MRAGALYAGDRPPRPVTEALCWAHGRRKFFELADIAANARRGKDAEPISPLALEAVRLIDAIFDLERTINGADSATRLALRREWTAPRLPISSAGCGAARTPLPPRQRGPGDGLHAQALGPILPGSSRTAGSVLTNNAAERALRGVALGRKAWLFCGSDRGGDRAAFMYTLITTAKLNDLDPQAWLGDVLARIANLPLSRLPELLPWEWARRRDATAIAA